MPSIDWGASNYGEFVWGRGGRIILGYPGTTNPSETLALRAIRPYSAPLRKLQPKDRSDGMDLYVYDKGNKEQGIAVNLKLSKSERDSLRTWFDVKANGSVNQLFYIDPHGAEHIIRIMDEAFDPQEEAHDKWIGKLIFRKEG